jgi:hypothetical protein
VDLITNFHIDGNRYEQEIEHQKSKIISEEIEIISGIENGIIYY